MTARRFREKCQRLDWPKRVIEAAPAGAAFFWVRGGAAGYCSGRSLRRWCRRRARAARRQVWSAVYARVAVMFRRNSLELTRPVEIPRFLRHSVSVQDVDWVMPVNGGKPAHGSARAHCIGRAR